MFGLLNFSHLPLPLSNQDPDQKMGAIDTAVLWLCLLLCAGWCLVGYLFQVTSPGPEWVAGVSEGLPWPRALNK